MVVFTSVLLGLLFVLFISAVFLFRHFSLHKYRFYDSITKQRPSLKTAINAKVAHKQENNAEKLSSIEKLGEWCQEECLTLGHSDQCWLPRQVICHNKDKTLQSYQIKNLYSETYTPPLPPERTVKFECVAFVRGHPFVQEGFFLPDTQNIFLKTPKCAEFYKVFKNIRI